MKKLAIAVILAGGFALAAPASAAVYCFDGAGRPLGSGFDAETPNYHQIELARRTGGHCRDLGRGNSLPGVDQPNYYYNNGHYQRRSYRQYDDGYREQYRQRESQRKDHRYPSTDPRYHQRPDYSKPIPPIQQQPNTAN